MPEDRLTIGDLARTTDTKVETIRYYEQIGLLPIPARTRGNYRSYVRRHLNRLRFIRRARNLGFSLAQVRGLLRLADQPERSCEAVDALRRELDRIISRCGHGTIARCRILSPHPEPSAQTGRM
jgi:DNA-binding transcriptional MerR regulator